MLFSAIQRTRESEQSVVPVDLNLETPPCIVLCCIALEAFVNEMSSLANTLLFNRRRDNQTVSNDVWESHSGITQDTCQNIAKIKNNRYGSFYDKYKDLIKALGIDKPVYMQELSYIRDLRDAIVHFRKCDVPIIEDHDGVIRSAQKPPDVFAHLRSHKVNGYPVIASESDADGIDWILRLSTNSMAIWCLTLVLDAIMYVLDNLSEGAYRDLVLRRYSARDQSFDTLFEKGKSDIKEWKNSLYSSL
jgi:hypothetical protein